MEPEVIFHHCAAGEVDLVIMDINLSGVYWQGQAVDGVDISRQLKERYHHLPILLVTAYALRTEQQSLLLNSQADGYFAKPITDYKSFLTTIAQLCQRSP